jgi:exonuclease SbcC
MIPQTLIVRNFMCYRDDVPELRLDGISIACLSGENGAGKSALLDAITWVLWGKARMSDEELLAVGTNEMEVELRFTLGGQDYRVIRKYQRSSGKRSGKSSLDLQVSNQGVWRAIGELQIRQTEEKIIDLLRMKYDTFINSAFLLQGRADEFTRKAPSERKQVLADILDLKEYADLEQKAKERVKQLHDKIKGVESLIEHLQIQADKRPIYQEAFEGAANWVADLNDALERAHVRLQHAQEQMRELEDAQRQQRERGLQIEKLRAEQVKDERQRQEYQATIAQAEDLLARRDAIMAGIASLNEARKELARLEGLRDRFDELNERRKDLKLLG